MKAVRIHQYGGPEVLFYEEIQRPAPAPDEVLIKVHAASVNPLDWRVRQGYMQQFLPLTLPLTLGWDFSGTVEAVGANVTQFKRGDEVYTVLDVTKGGAYAEYAIANASDVALKPKSVDHIHAAGIPVAGVTAWQALIETAQLRAGQKVLVHAAAGGVGVFAVQFAKAKGAYVIGTASGKNQAFLRELGVDQVVDYEKTRFEDVAHDVDIVLDTIGGEVQERSWKVLKKGGFLVSIVAPPDAEKAAKYGVRAAMFRGHPDSAALGEIARLVDAGRVKTVVDTVLPLADARRAQELSAHGHARGKIVLKVA
ncbi:MAG TPA: NADP-dependent oxidoreductase [Candidatus Acidoferrales bacterium]|nr:NADP-dependent oxidoreductase [Candidatus Acidoferrales bacterium]